MKKVGIVLWIVVSFIICSACSSNAKIDAMNDSGDSESNINSANLNSGSDEVELDANYILLQPKCPRTMKYSVNDCLEFDNKIIFCWYNGDCLTHEYVLEAFDTDSGKSLHKGKVASNASDGRLFQMEKCSAQDGFDYRLIFENCMIYKNSAKPKKEWRYDLPNTIKKSMEKIPMDSEYFDHYKNRVVWCAQDGVWMAESDGSNANLMISNSTIAEFMTLEANEKTSNLSYVHPRFICNGSKIVAAVYSDKYVYYQGFIIFDITNHVVEKCVQTKHQEFPDYPYLDRYVQVFSMNQSI